MAERGNVVSPVVRESKIEDESNPSLRSSDDTILIESAACGLDIASGVLVMSDFVKDNKKQRTIVKSGSREGCMQESGVLGGDESFVNDDDKMAEMRMERVDRRCVREFDGPSTACVNEEIDNSIKKIDFDKTLVNYLVEEREESDRYFSSGAMSEDKS